MTPNSMPAAVRARSASDSIVGRIWVFAQSHPALAVFLLALVVRVFIATVLSRYFSGTLVLDDTTYHQLAVDMASGETGNWDDFTNTLYWATATFMVPVTVLYKVFGPNAIAGQLLIGLVGAATALFVTRLAMEFLETRWAVFAGCAVALLPSQAFWSSMLMKDAFVWFVLSGLALTVAVAARSTRGKLLLLGVIAACFLIALSYLRLHTLVVASWSVMIATFFGWKLFRPARVAGAVAIGILVPFVFGGIGLAGLGLVTNAASLEDRRFANAVGANTAVVDTSEPSQDSPEIVAIEEEVTGLEEKAEELEAQAASSSPAKAEKLKEEAADIREEITVLEAQRAQFEGSAPPRPVDTGPLDPDVAHLPRGLSVMLFEPFPLPFSGSISLRLARLETVLWYPLIVLAGIGLVHAFSHLRQLAFPLLAGAGIVVMYALTEGNVGTAHRHRGEFVWVVALLAALGAKRLWDRREVSA